ncbi:MAG: hypothetical protein NTW13_01210 [Candidatus Omnitrophica bacterium]|nr:hypothetical protein [Candidatus Omnitrophota bacterium]
MLKKIPITKVIILAVIFLAYFLLSKNSLAQTEAVETIIYDISPFGTSEYRDFGAIEFLGTKTNLVIFETDVAGLGDTEVIYSAADTGLPLRVERDVNIWLHKENITEEYFPNEGKLTIIKFEAGKKTEEYFFESKKGPIHNAVLVPFSLRKIPNLEIGWTYDIRLPQEFKVKLISIEEVVVPAGKFKAYHFTSTPPKFEIWITSDALRIPVKIKGLESFPYTLSMKERKVKENK